MVAGAGEISAASIGETDLTVWVEQTGHTMSGVLLDYWRATGRDRFFGNPISEPFATADGVWGQAMERGIIQFVPDLAWTVEPFVRFMPAGRMLMADLNGWVGVDGESGVPVADSFAEWYDAHEGRFYLGLPLTGRVDERGVVGQWFEGGLLLEAADSPQLAPLGEELARRPGVPTNPVPGIGRPVDDERLFLTVPNPAPGGDPTGPGAKRIEVNVTRQRVDCLAGDVLALSSPISTGRWPNKTEIGNFRIRYKKRREDMRGATDAAGRVVWVVGDGGDRLPGSIPYGVADMPDVMYCNLQAEALHGVYWHNNFGAPMSRGCVNLPLDVAAWMYDWAPLGAPVRVFLEEGHVYPGAENATAEELRLAEEDGKRAGGV